MKYKEFEIEIYSFTFGVHYDAGSFVEMTGGEPAEGDFITRGVHGEVRVLINGFMGGIQDPKFIQCLSHECNHAAMHILGMSGVRFDFDNQETLCYLQDYLIRKSYEFALELNEEIEKLNTHLTNKGKTDD